MASTLVKYAARHLAAMVVIVGTAAGLLGALYIALLLIAIVFNQGIGSPAALPLWLFIVTITSALICLTLFMPATVVSDAIGRWRTVSLQHKFATAIASYSGLLLGGSILWPLIDNTVTFSTSLATGGIVAVILIVPMTGYWFMVQFSGWVIRVATAACKRLATPPTPPAGIKTSARPLYLNPVRKKPPLH